MRSTYSFRGRLKAPALGLAALGLCAMAIFAARVYAQKAEQEARVAGARETLAKHLGTGAISGAAMDEMLKVIQAAGDKDIEPLMRRIRMLEKLGPDYAEDFALWWSERGRREVGGAVLWDRKSLRESFDVLGNPQGVENKAKMSQAMRLVQKSADTGFPPALFIQSYLKLTGMGRSDFDPLGMDRRAAEWMSEATKMADQGDPDAGFAIIVVYHLLNRGWKDTRSPETIKYLQSAADAGITPAMTILAQIYLDQSSGPGDAAKAAELYRRAAEKGNSEAMEAYIKMLSTGLGVPKDLAKARELREKMTSAGGEEGTKQRIARAKSEMRSFATAIESYFIDNNRYPAMTRDTKLSINSDLAGANPEAFRGIGMFRRKLDPNDRLITLTTPISYITNFLPDPFAPAPGATYAYATPIDHPDPLIQYKGWMLWSPGPDGAFDLTGSLGEYDPSQKVPSLELILKTYDPTNGIVSRGDIWRVKQ